MPTQISGRVALILAVLWFSLSSIFPSVPPSLFWLMKPSQTINFHPNLKPGIDMVGGTSLLYEIKAPEGVPTDKLSEKVMKSLKERVDPQGVKNLIWRPQGNTRLEIQMPMNEETRQSAALRAQFGKAQEALEATNVRPGEAQYVIQDLTGEARVAEIQRLEQDSELRGKTLAAMATTWDQLQIARDQKNAADQAKFQLQYNTLSEQLNSTNLSVTQLQSALDIPRPEARDLAIQALKDRFKDFPSRLKMMQAFIDEYARFNQVKGSIDDSSELKRMLRGSGVIEFHILANDLTDAEYAEKLDNLNRRGPRPQAGDRVRWYEVDRSVEVAEQVETALQTLSNTTDPRAQTDIIKRLAENRTYIEDLIRSAMRTTDPDTRRSIQREIESNLVLSGYPLADYGGKKWALLYTTPDRALMKRDSQPDWALEQASIQRDQGELNVAFSMNPAGARMFGELTGNNLEKALAIVLDDKLISAPRINSQINGRGSITGGGRGGFSVKEATYLVNTLNAGALPAQLAEEPITEQTVGPQLGADNLKAGLKASIIGLIAVAIFMLFYYHLSGVVAVVALMMNMIMILGVMAALNATFTLPAVAGIVLTIGMSVDANVLIFERLREEQKRGLSLKMALRNAYDRAASAIIDSNAVTAITCLILYAIGSEEVKGFGLTLLIGLVSSLFTALFVTRTIFAGWINNFHLQKLGSLPMSFPKFEKALIPHVNWMRIAKVFICGSLVFTLLGFIALGVVIYRGQFLDIEFSSGTAVQFDLKDPMSRAEVDELISKSKDLPSPSVVAVGEGNITYEVVTPNDNAPRVKEAVLAALAGKLNLLEPSDYDMVDTPSAELVNQAIVPITSETRNVAGVAPRELRSHVGGVAIVLKNLAPKLSAEQIRTRIQQIRLQVQAGGGKSGGYHPIDVAVSADGSTALVMTSDPASVYDASDPIKIEQWTEELARPTWDTVREAVHNPPQLKKVSTFNPQVAGEMQRGALMALVMSVGVIMIYIWLRFGNVKYGAANVVAMLHDTVMVLAAIGLSHFLAGTFIGDLLLIEPFRINLTIVAAILTVMSYSMVDTIVVFDRIRENRGKFGHADAAVINDSINQTLSRTMLTAGTTVLTCLVMYVFGGKGIHGFTFVMLVGILAGTYSSIAIAAPILLLGESPDAAPSKAKGATTGQRQFQGA
jgi:SecD/SecF fusion protein